MRLSRSNASRAALVMPTAEGMHGDCSDRIYSDTARRPCGGDSSHVAPFAAAALLCEPERVRSKIVDLISLAEMKWRYRVVAVGQSPRDESVKILSRAKAIIEQHAHAVGASVEGTPTSGNEAAQMCAYRDASAEFQRAWASEQSAILQGLGVTRLIFNTSREEDEEIEALLSEALMLREGAEQHDSVAETLNSLGALKQKQKAYDGAHAYYQRSLELRRAQSEASRVGGGKPEKERMQNEAQSLVSLGNLAIERGDAAGGVDATEAGGQQVARAYYEEAVNHLRAAKDAYVAGFHETHPKVAWAMEGLGKIYEKQGNLGAALEEYNGASHIRRTLQSKSGNMQMFSNELNHNESRVSSIAAKLQAALGAGASKVGGACASIRSTAPALLSA